MGYRVDRLEVQAKTTREELERFLNQLEGTVLAVVPHVSPVFQGMSATSRTDFLLVVEAVD